MWLKSIPASAHAPFDAPGGDGGGADGAYGFLIDFRSRRFGNCFGALSAGPGGLVVGGLTRSSPAADG